MRSTESHLALSGLVFVAMSRFTGRTDGTEDCDVSSRKSHDSSVKTTESSLTGGERRCAFSFSCNFCIFVSKLRLRAIPRVPARGVLRCEP